MPGSNEDGRPGSDITLAGRRSYDLNTMDRAAEERRLAVQVEAAAALERPHLSRLRLSPIDRVLDLGCGPGFLSVDLGRRCGRLIGVDIDPEMVRLANDRFRKAGLDATVIHASGDDLPFQDQSFDVVVLRFVLQHVPDPAAVLAEAFRVLGPGGRLLVCDTDDGGFVLHPAPAGLEEFLAAAIASQSELGGNRRIGRELPGLVRGAGFARVRVDVQPATSEDLGLVPFLDIALGFKRQIIDSKHMHPDQVRRVIADCYALEGRSGVFGMALAYFLTAWK
jgi:SAM-dependent methyltransferase